MTRSAYIVNTSNHPNEDLEIYFGDTNPPTVQTVKPGQAISIPVYENPADHGGQSPWHPLNIRTAGNSDGPFTPVTMEELTACMPVSSQSS